MIIKEPNSGSDQYQTFFKLLIKIIIPVFCLLFLYLAYTPVPVKTDNTSANFTIGDVLFLITLLLLFIAAILFYSSKLLEFLRASMEKMHNHRFGPYINCLLFCSAVLVLLSLYFGFSSSIIKAVSRLSNPNEPLNIRNIFLGFASIVGLILLAWRSYAMDKRANIAEGQRKIEQDNLNLSEQRRLDERFSKALDILSKKLTGSSYASHVGAITELSKLAIDSNDHTQGCINAICACNQWMDYHTEAFLQQHRKGIFSSRKLSIDNSILSGSNAYHQSPPEERSLSLIQEKLSQEALRAIAHILKHIGQRSNSKERLGELSFQNKMLCGIDLSNVVIDYVNFSRAYLTAANFSKASLRGADLYKANLKGSQFLESKLLAANLVQTKLMGASFVNADMSGVNLHESALHGVNMHGANLQGASLVNVSLNGAYLRNVNFMGASLNKSKFTFCMLLQCNLYGARMKGAVDFFNIIYDDIGVVETLNDVDRRKGYLMKSREFFNPIGNEFDFFSERMGSAWRAIDMGIKPEKIEKIENSSLIEKRARTNDDNSKGNSSEVWQFTVDGENEIKAFLANHVDDLFDVSDITENDLSACKEEFIKNPKIDPVGYRAINFFREYYSKDLAQHYPFLHESLKDILKDLKRTINDSIKTPK